MFHLFQLISSKRKKTELVRNFHAKAFEAAYNTHIDRFILNSPEANVYHTSFPIISDIFNTKNAICSRKGIDLHISYSIEKLRMNDYELLIILGNLFDYAIALLDTKNEAKKMHFSMLQVNDYIQISSEVSTLATSDFSFDLSQVETCVRSLHGTFKKKNTDSTHFIRIFL